MEEQRIVIQKFVKIFTDKSECYNIWLKVANDTLNKYFHGKRGRAYKAEDVVQEVILKIIDGIRKWDFNEFPDLNHFMIWNIKSYIHGLYKKERYYDYIHDISNDENDEINTLIIPACISPENIEFNYEVMEKIRLFYEKLEAAKEYECLKVIDYLRLEYKNAEIAEKLEIKISDVVNIKKRIKNKLRLYFDGHNSGPNRDTKKIKQIIKNKKRIEISNEEFINRIINERNEPEYKNYFMIFNFKNNKKNLRDKIPIMKKY